MNDYTVKKSVCERYDLKFGDFGWAIITIDENGGLFNSQSDYGSYSYSWPRHGRKSFKHFLIEISRDSSYFLGKVSSDRDYFDFDRNLSMWKKEIIKQRKNGTWTDELSKEDARYIWDFIIDIDGSMPYQNIQSEIYGNSLISKICGGEPWYVFETITDYPPSAVAFAKEVMPIFADILRKELAIERAG